MKERFRFLLFYFFYWILFFLSARFLFLIYHFSETKTIGFKTSVLSFIYGLKMDISVASYILLPVSFFIFLGLIINIFNRPLLYKSYTYLVLILILLITTTDLEVYRSWGFRIDATPLQYLNAPKEAWASVSHLPLVWIFLVVAIVYSALCVLFGSMMERNIKFPPVRNKILSATVFLFFAAFLIIPIRGGVNQIPINQSSVYFSKNNFANIAAINATWNFVNDLTKPAANKNPYNYLNGKKLSRIVDSLYSHSDKTSRHLKTSRPNVIIVIWESFTEKATRAQINGIDITPRFNQLKKEGIYFENVYASGDRTDKGLAAILSGYPAINNFSIVRSPRKSSKLESLSGFFKRQGYQTSFYYGGETEFANIKSYLLQSQFDYFTERKDFPSKDQNSKWGAHDGVVAQKILRDLSGLSQPFFTTWLTLSSHEPFETPEAPAINGSNFASKFANSLHYTDKVLYQFVQQCKERPWWNNTLLIVIADHGHPLLEPSDLLNNFRIPMLWLGGALADSGVVNSYASQIDLAKTLVQQLKTDDHSFPFSKDIFDSSSKHWAYFSFNNGFGWAEKEGAFVFDNVGNQIILKQGNVTSQSTEAGKSMQQHSFGDYIIR